MHERLKEARKYLKLSQEFVARQMHLSRPTISAIESGQRKVTAEELAGFSKLYGVSVDELMYGKTSGDAQVEMFARAFASSGDRLLCVLFHHRAGHRLVQCRKDGQGGFGR